MTKGLGQPASLKYERGSKLASPTFSLSATQSRSPTPPRSLRLIMLNISRTTVPESWLATPIPFQKPRGTKPNMITSRISVSTINTDLWPELITWAAVIESQSPASCSQKIPTDVHSKREHDVDTVHEATVTNSLSSSRILDPTSVEFGFDQSCFNGLDDCLAYSPMEAFEEACWTQATHSRPDRIPTANPLPRSNPRRIGGCAGPRSPLATSGSSDDDSDTDSDDSMTFTDDDVHLDIAPNGGLSASDPTREFLTYANEKSLYYGDEERTSFIFFDSGFTVPDPKNSVGFFPIPTLSRKTVPSRIAAFCANIPGSLTFVRSPNAS